MLLRIPHPQIQELLRSAEHSSSAEFIEVADERDKRDVAGALFMQILVTAQDFEGWVEGSEKTTKEDGLPVHRGVPEAEITLFEHGVVLVYLLQGALAEHQKLGGLKSGMVIMVVHAGWVFYVWVTGNVEIDIGLDCGVGDVDKLLLVITGRTEQVLLHGEVAEQNDGPLDLELGLELAVLHDGGEGHREAP